MIPYGRQSITDADIQAVKEVLQSDFLTQGPAVPRFEAAVALRCDAPHAVAVSSATAALHIACLALGVGPGDWVWTSPITFVASANCALYCGARVDFVDIDPETGNMSIDELVSKLEAAERLGTLPKVVIPVHFSGQPCDMKAIHALSQQYGFSVIEDASHAVGGLYEGTAVGASVYSDISIFSFHPVKIITTAEGGMALTRNSALAEKMQLLRTHGITRNAEEMSKAPDGPWYYEQLDLGFNYRMTDMQAALGLSQLARLDQFISRRHEIAEQYDSLLAGLPVASLRREENSYSALHLYILKLNLSRISVTRREVFEAMRQAGVGVQVHYIPVHLQPFYRNLGFKKGDFPAAEKFYEQIISLPIYPTLSDDEQEQVIIALREALGCGADA